METQTVEGFRGPQVCSIVGISYRQLDYWARTKLAGPTLQAAQGSGSQRLYSFEDLVTLKLIKNLLDTGISLQKVREAVDYLSASENDLHGVTIASDGRSVYACRSAEEVVDLIRKGQGVFSISIDPVMDELTGSISEMRRKEAEEQAAAVEGVTRVVRIEGGS